jgi:hypothetical protein
MTHLSHELRCLGAADPKIFDGSEKKSFTLALVATRREKWCGQRTA